jgi:hypothetical protein
MYSGGSIYNPAQVMRDATVNSFTLKLDSKVANIKDKSYLELPIEEIRDLIALTKPDAAATEYVWNPVAVGESLMQFGKLHNQKTGVVYVDRDRGLKENRRETQGILDGGEAGTVPKSRITLFLLRTRPDGKSSAAWWPQIRFPDGRYAFAFSI